MRCGSAPPTTSTSRPTRSTICGCVCGRSSSGEALQQENVLLKRQLGTPNKFANIVGRQRRAMAVFELIETIAPTSSTVLITGESGTGKELVARAIHADRRARATPVRRGQLRALPRPLLESELFGHVRGAFTGADTNKQGLFEVADGGTIFLDEIGEMSPMMQVKLLRVLQERKFRASAAPTKSRSTSASSPRPTATSPRWSSRRVPRGSLLPDQRGPGPLPPLRERRTTSAARGALRREASPSADEEGDRGISGAALRACGLRLAGQRPRARERDRARGRAGAHAGSPARQPSRGRPRRGRP